MLAVRLPGRGVRHAGGSDGRESLCHAGAQRGFLEELPGLWQSAADEALWTGYGGLSAGRESGVVLK